MNGVIFRSQMTSASNDFPRAFKTELLFDISQFFSIDSIGEYVFAEGIEEGYSDNMISDPTR